MCLRRKMSKTYVDSQLNSSVQAQQSHTEKTRDRMDLVREI